MRCWECHRLIVLPDIINGRKGHQGEIRRKEMGQSDVDAAIEETPDADWKSKGTFTRFGCNHCGTQYQMAVRATGKRPTTTQIERRSKGEGWD